MLTPIIIYYDKENTQIYECYFIDENGVKTGPTLRRHKNGRKQYEGKYNNGQKDGNFKYYDEDENLIEEGTYKNGLIDGCLKTYYPNGQLKKECWLCMGTPSGITKLYNEDGSLKEECVYDKNGRLCHSKHYKKAIIHPLQNLIQERRKTLDAIMIVRTLLGYGDLQRQMIRKIVQSFQDKTHHLPLTEKYALKNNGRVNE